MPADGEIKPTTIQRLAIGLHYVALLSLLGAVLLPDCVLLFALAVAAVAGWQPLGLLLRGRGGYVARVMLVLGCCLYIAGAEELHDLPRVGEDGALVAVGLPLAWLICLLTIPEGMVFSFPLGLLGCINAAVRLPADTRAWPGLIGLATAALLASGALFYLDGLKHPAGGRSLLGRASVWRFSPHLAVALLAAALMSTTANWFGTQAGWLVSRLPAGAESGICELVSAPPAFTGRRICRVRAQHGPLPHYLAERVYDDYQSGAWIKGEPCISSPVYGLDGQPATGLETFRCQIEMLDTRGKPLVPFRVIKQKSGPPGGQAGSGTPWFHFSEWLPDEGLASEPPPAKQWLQLGELPKLRERSELLCRGTTSDLGRTLAIANYLRQRGRYDASQPFRTFTEMDPVEEFLFHGGQGWCVHFASAATLMLRAVGVPARFVTGYVVSGTTEIAADVLDRDGHAWCEAYVQSERGARWVIVDPSITPGGDLPTAAGLSRLLVGMLLAAAALGVLVYTMLTTGNRQLRQEADTDLGKPEREQVEAIYQRVVRAFARQGCHCPPSLTPREFASTVVPAAHRLDAGIVVEAFERVRYMGYARLGRERLAALRAAQRRLLAARL